MSVDYLNYLVTDLGFSCIKHFVIFNEPDGIWASTNGDYELWKNVLFRFHEKMKTYPGLLEKVSFAALLRQVTPERIRAAAQSVQLDTIYFLKGKEA